MKGKVFPFITISIALLCILLPFSYKSIVALKLDTSIDAILGTDDRTRDTYENFNKAFAGRTTVVAVVKLDNLFSNEGAKTLYEISNTLAKIPNLHDIKSLTHSARPVRKGFNIDITKIIQLEPFIDLRPKSDEEWLVVKNFLTEYPMTRDILVSNSGNYTVIMSVLDNSINTIEHKKKIMATVEDAMKPFRQQGLDIHFLSEPFIAVEFHDMITHSAFWFVALCFLFSSIIILITFRSFRIYILISCYQLAGFVIFPIIFYLNSTDINIYTFVVIPLISSVQLTFLSHFYATLQDFTEQDKSYGNAFCGTLKTVLPPSFIAMITTGIGLASLWSSDFEILQGVGKIGVQALVAIFALTFLPAFIYSQFLKDSNTNATTIAKAVISKDSRLLRFTKSHCRTLVCITPFFLGTFYFWNQHISSDMRTREFLDKSSQTRIAMDLMDEHMGGINIFQVSVKASKPRGIQEYEVIRYLHDLRNKALEIPGVQNAYTYSQFFTTIHQLFLGDNFSNGNVLPNQAQSQIYTQLLNSQSFPFQNVIENEDKSSTVFFLRCQDIRSTDFLHIVEKFIEVSAENKPQDLEIIINNGIHSILASDRKIVNSQMNSILWSLASIFICLALLWRKPLFAIIVILTNSLPIVAIASCLYLLNIPLNSITVMVAPVILGIAVDDAIHFLTYYQKRVNFGLSRELALKETLAKKIRPIICTSLILASSFLMFIVAPFPPLRHFGILGCIALLTALISTLFLIPAFLQFFEKYQRTQNNETET